MPTARLSARGLRFRYADSLVLDGIDLDIAAGERVAILGPNGAGKSTLLRLLAGTLRPAQGRVLLDGMDLSVYPGAERARRIAFVPQESRVVFDFSVLEIVLMGRSPRLGLLGIESRLDLEAAWQALRFTATEHLAERPISRLSSGERQRVLLARALAQEPETILLDEPTAFLDIGHQAQIHNLLESLNRERAMTIVFISHDLNLAARHAERVAVLAGGRIVARGSPRAVLTPEIIRAIFGVETVLIETPALQAPAIVIHGLPGAGEAP